MSGYPTQTQFAEQIGTRFAAPDAEFVLDAVTPGFESEGYAPFSLRFSSDAHVPQATYELAHEVLGRHQVFLVPIASDGVTTRYEAVFNVEKGSEG